MAYCIREFRVSIIIIIYRANGTELQRTLRRIALCVHVNIRTKLLS